MIRETKPPAWWGQSPKLLRIRLAFIEIARAEAVREACLAVPRAYAAYDVGKALGRAEEREACAQIADAEAKQWDGDREEDRLNCAVELSERIAASIRARGAA